MPFIPLAGGEEPPPPPPPPAPKKAPAQAAAAPPPQLAHHIQSAMTASMTRVLLAALLAWGVLSVIEIKQELRRLRRLAER